MTSPPDSPESTRPALVELAVMMRRLRQQAGMSQRALATRMSYVREYVTLAERGNRLPSRDFLIRYASELDAMETLLPLYEAARGEDQTIKQARQRRRLHDALSLAADSGAVEIESWELTQALEESSIGGEALKQLETAVGRYAASYPRTPAIRLRDPVLRHLRRVVRLLGGPLPVDHRRRLVVVLGELAGVAGNVFYDLKRYPNAWGYLDSAVAAAKEAEDRDLEAWSLATQSLIPTYAGDHEEALILIEKARGVAVGHASPSRQAWICALAARARAGVGDEDGCRRAIGEASRTLDRATPASRRPGTDFFDAPRLRGIDGTCWLLLGRSNTARNALDEALALRDPADIKGRALLRLDVASTHLFEGDFRTACQVIGTALAIPEENLVEPIMRRYRALRCQLEPWNGTRAVRSLDDQLGTVEQ
jgi:transcriptional regulator with XRE-family HTH domain